MRLVADMTAVDEFLDGLTEDYTALYKDNTTLKAKLKMLAEKVEEYRATEDAMRSTLLAAQKMAAQMVADAQAEKEKTIADAQAQAEQILADARGEADVQARQLQQEIRDSWEKLATAQSETEDFIQRSHCPPHFVQIAVCGKLNDLTICIGHYRYDYRL